MKGDVFCEPWGFVPFAPLYSNIELVARPSARHGNISETRSKKFQGNTKARANQHVPHVLGKVSFD
jgi:hypothetical protein